MLITKTKKVKINFRMKTKEIADWCGVTEATVRNWKSGRAFPTPRHIAKLLELEATKK
jgi:DNA-binding transcriptional regulator YiaG